MSQHDQDRADFEAWHLKTRGHVNADNHCRMWLQEKDWETWRAARSNQPLVTELLEALIGMIQIYQRRKPGVFGESTEQVIAARAAIAKAKGEPA